MFRLRISAILRQAHYFEKHKQRILCRYGKYTHIRSVQQIIDVQYKNIIHIKIHVQY